jgi:hypothetical protein
LNLAARSPLGAIVRYAARMADVVDSDDAPFFFKPGDFWPRLDITVSPSQTLEQPFVGLQPASCAGRTKKGFHVDRH